MNQKLAAENKKAVVFVVTTKSVIKKKQITGRGEGVGQLAGSADFPLQYLALAWPNRAFYRLNLSLDLYIT